VVGVSGGGGERDPDQAVDAVVVLLDADSGIDEWDSADGQCVDDGLLVRASVHGEEDEAGVGDLRRWADHGEVASGAVILVSEPPTEAPV
jgi:hypothetical protein